jgi:nitroreductase
VDVETAIKTRRAIRFFDDEPIPTEIVTRILDAGRLAPSSKNSQPVRMIVIRNREQLKKISKMTYSGDFIAQAQFAIAIITKDAKLPELDKEILGVPMTGRYRLITVIPFGYPHPNAQQPRGKRIRHKLEEVAFNEEWGIPWGSS